MKLLFIHFCVKQALPLIFGRIILIHKFICIIKMSGKQRLKSKYDYTMRLYLVSIKYPPSKLSNTKNFPRQIVFPPLGRKWLYLHICIQFSQIARVLQRYQIMYLILTRALQNQWSVICIVFPCVLRKGKILYLHVFFC